MADFESIVYSFRFADGDVRQLEVKLNLPSLEMVSEKVEEIPDWVRLEFNQCPNCTLSADMCEVCPVAYNLVPVSSTFCSRISYDRVGVTIATEARSYYKECSLQDAVSSLMGLVMATSGCPHLDKLRPMAFTHLPFSTTAQTTFRAVSMYLLAQYFKQQHGQTPDWELKNLAKSYEDVRIVNKAFAERLRSMQKKDANLNAIAQLDCHADLASFSIGSQWWEEFEGAFQAYLNEPETVGVK